MNTPAAILLVQPPMQHPAFFNVAYRHAAGALAGMNTRATLFHAGMDYVTGYLTAPGVLEKLAARVRLRMAQGHYAQADAAQVRLAASLTGEPHNWPHRFDSMRDCPALLRSDAFFDPPAAGRALQLLDQAFALVSAAYHPAVLDRRGFRHPDLKDAGGLRRFVGDADRNPFWTYAHNYCRPLPAEAQWDLVLFVLGAPGQLPGAATLADAWKRGSPRVPMAVVAANRRLRRSAERLMGLDAHPSACPEIVTRVQQALAAGGAGPSTGGGEPLLMPAEAVAAAPENEIHYAPLQPGPVQGLLRDLEAADRGVIAWHDPRGDPAVIHSLLYQAARKGFWNHVVLPESSDEPLSGPTARFAAANPNIVHSWCRRSGAVFFASDEQLIYPHGNPPYGRTRPLPGVPVWQWLQDPVYLQAYLIRWGARALARMYLVNGGQALHVAGSRLEYHYQSPQQLPPGYLDEICRMVAAGGSVQTQWVRHNLERAYLVAYAEENGVIVGSYSLKHPRQEYIEAVSRQAGLDLRRYLERGYASVRPEYRGLGIGARLLEGLTRRAGEYKIFSVIADDNVATQKMAMRKGTRKVAGFFSQRAQKRVGVWIPERMLPEGTTLPEQPDLESRP